MQQEGIGALQSLMVNSSVPGFPFHRVMIVLQVIDQNNGLYRCEKCQREFQDFKWRTMLSVSSQPCSCFWLIFTRAFISQINITDATEQQWVTCFQDTAEALLGKFCIMRTLFDTLDNCVLWFLKFMYHRFHWQAHLLRIWVAWKMRILRNSQRSLKMPLFSGTISGCESRWRCTT